MKRILILIIFLGLTISVFAKVYFAEKEEMIDNAYIIAVVDITDIKNLEGKGPHYSQEVTASSIKTFKGVVEKQLTFFVPTHPVCAPASLKKGQYLVFLRKNNNALEGCNWHFSYRPINDNKVEWVKIDFMEASATFEMIDLQEVIDEITKILKK